MSKLKNKNDEEEGDDDEEDEDYVPDGLNESLSNEEDNLDEENEVKAKKRKSKNSRDDDDSESDSDGGVENQNGSSKEKDSQDVTLEFDKKKADDLWSSFLKDVKPASLASNSSTGSNKYKLADNKASVRKYLEEKYETKWELSYLALKKRVFKYLKSLIKIITF